MKKRMPVKCEKERPTYANEHAAGLDLRLLSDQPITIEHHEMKRLRTGVCVEIPQGHFGLVAMRSGLGFRGLSLTNGVGIIDEDYRGEIGLSVVNFSEEPFILEPGERIAQLIIIPFEHPELEFVEHLTPTGRGEKGFGSSGRF